MGVALALLAVGIRYALISVMADVAPYALMYVAVTLALILAGWRSGAVAMVVGQLLTWLLIVRPSGSLAAASSQDLAGLLTASLSETLLIVVIALYQRQVDKGITERERRMELLDQALREIDHRTRNNYQTVLAMIQLQAGRENDGPAKAALEGVIERIRALANASQQLAVRSADLAGVRLDDHLCGLVQQIGRGLSREGIDINCEVDAVTASIEKATSISIIVNELVTNAIKHAFNGEGSGHVVVQGRRGSKFELTVSDDGRGIAGSSPTPGTGLGSRLVESFARQLHAQHEVISTEQGTTHRLLIPSLS